MRYFACLARTLAASVPPAFALAAVLPLAFAPDPGPSFMALDPPPQVSPRPSLRAKPAVLEHDLAVRDDGRRDPLHHEPLVDAPAAPMVLRLRRDRTGPLGIPHDEIGIRTHRDRALSRVEPEDLRRPGGDEVDELIRIEPPFRDPVRPEK